MGIYVPADDLTDPAPATTFAHLDAMTVLSRQIAELGIYPAVDPLDSTSRMMDPSIVGQHHYDIARRVQKVLQDYKSLQDIIAILGMDELSEGAKLAASSTCPTVSRGSRSSSMATAMTFRRAPSTWLATWRKCCPRPPLWPSESGRIPAQPARLSRAAGWEPQTFATGAATRALKKGRFWRLSFFFNSSGGTIF